MKQEPSFLASPTWHDTLRAVEQSLKHNLFASSLKESNERSARLSILLRGSDLVFQCNCSSHVKLEAQSLMQQFIELYAEIRNCLDRNSFRRTNPETQDASAIIICKYALALLIIETTLLKLTSFIRVNDDAWEDNSVKRGLAKNTSYAFIDSCSSRIEDELDKVFDIFHTNFVVATRTTPFSTRKFAFMCRVMCENIRLGADQHSVWDRVGKVVEELNGSFYMPKVHSVALEDSVKTVNSTNTYVSLLLHP